MASENNLRVNELNFELIKSNLKNYLSAQDQFRDYNFDGSGINVLLDLLAYNTYYNSFYLNMVASEAFLSTAQKRNSVVNLARSLNYTPRSVTASALSGTITATVTGSPSSITIPKYTEFTGRIDNKTYTFLTTEATTLFSSDSYVGEVSLKEGKSLSYRYTVNPNDTEQRFLIPNTNVDTSTLTVRVLNSSTDSTSRTFTNADNLVEVTSTSRIYFLSEVENGQFEIKFGDNTFGVALDAGNVIVLEYIVANGADGNGFKNLTYADSISGVTTIAFTATDSSAGGSDRESISSIRFNAPKSYEAQNRVVTAEDYKTLLLKQSSVDAVVVWGGEDNDPPQYGKVFIAVKPVVGSALSPTEKNNLIETVINPKKVLTVSTEIVDPEYLYLLVDVTVKYNSDATTLSEGSLRDAVETVISNYNSTEINTFSKYFRYSQLSRLIDFADRSILNNVLSIRMRREQAVQLSVPTRYEIDFSNAIDSATESRPTTHPYGAQNKVTSNAFTYAGLTNCFLEDNGGLMRIYRITATGSNVGVLNNAGTINYATGKVVLTNFTPSAFSDGGTTLKLTAIPAGKDILPLRKQIIAIRDADVTVTMLDDKTISLVSR
jgi:hypothetical protein